MVKSLKVHGLLTALCLLIVSSGIAQTLAQHNWYFGNSTGGIRFNRIDNSATLVTNQFIPFGTGGSAVATNPTNANLIFYTDGSRVLDLTHTQMPNGGGLNGLTTANQPVAICPVPGTPSRVYIFTNTANFTTGGTISVTTVDLNAFGNAVFPAPALGDVTTKNVATGLAGRSEAMIIVPHANGNDFWLISHQNGTDNYSATLIDAGGAFPTIPSPNVTGFPISAANFSYHEATGRLAVSPQTADRNVMILNFNNLTGAITLNQAVLNSGITSTINQAIYDTEWSNNGRYLYISRHGQAGIPADVVQFDLLNPGISLATVLPGAPFRSYGLQMAPDSAIYHLYQAVAAGPFLLGALTNTDSVATSVLYAPTAFPANPNLNGTQFPAFIPVSSLNLSVSFTSVGACATLPVSFYPVVSPAADSLVWDFGDGNTSNSWSPFHTYQLDGTYNVTVTAFLNGQSANSVGVVNIGLFDLVLDLVADTTACRCEFPPPVGNSCNGGPFNVTVNTQGGSGSLTYTWSNGDTGPTLTPDSAGYYYVVVTDATGCKAYAGVNIREYNAIDQRANIWYFGDHAGIDFNTPVTAITGPLDTPEGCSVISDRNGFVIFSTDGVRVYDRNDTEITSAGGIPIPVPPGIGGEQGATQSALIVPVPGDETLYYIFTTQEVHGTNSYELRYSLYDIKENNGDGGLIEYNQLLFTRSTERITANANWLIAHEYGNNSFRAYPISQTGIGNPVITSIGSDHRITDAYNGQGYMKLGPNNILAVALPSFGVSNVLEIFDFNPITGVVTNFRSVDLNSAAEQVYGIEFAGNKIFATLRGTPSFIREVYLDFQSNPILITPVAPSIPEELGAIQLGPDGQLYVAVNNQPFLGLIQVNPDTLQVSTFVLNGFALAGGTTSQLGLPNFAQQIGSAPSLPSITVAGFCLGSPTDFTGAGTDPVIDQFQWSFGDGFGSTTQVAQHTYAAPGDYTVTLRITNRCGLDTLLTQLVTIAAPPANPNFLPLGQQPVLCNGPLTLEAEPAPGTAGYTYLWSNGDITRTTIVTQQSLVSVTITNAQGCATTGSIIVADNQPQVDLGPDQTICQNDPIAPLNAQNPGTNYQWFLNDVGNGNFAQTQSVNSTVAGIFEYKVEVTDPITTCVGIDSVIFTINTSPTFTTVVTNTSVCGANDGQIALTITGPPSTLFSYLLVGAGTGTTLQGIDRTVGAVLPVFAPLPADTYIIQVTDQVSGCATTSPASITDNAFTITSVLRQTTCDPLILRVNHTAIVTPYSYNVIDAVSGLIVASGASSSIGFFDTPGVPSGTYIIEMTSGGCSFSSPPQAFTQDPEVNITGFTVDGCVNPITVSVNGGTGWTWSGPNITSSNLIQTITATPPQGNQVYTVQVTEAGFCPLDTAVTVFVNNNVVVDFDQDDACQDQVTLTATVTPAGTYTYRWYRNGVLILGGQSIIATITDNGVNYRVEAVNTVSGCVFTSGNKPAVVAGNLQVFMDTTTPCEGDQFTLTATTIPPGVATYQWAYRGNSIPGATNDTHIDTRSGLYQVTASVPGCDVSTEQFIILFDSPVGSLPNRALICNEPGNPNPDTREVLLDADPRGGTGFTYQWYLGGVILNGETDQTFLVTEPGIYSVDMVNSFGCTGTDQTEVIRECLPIIVAPTAFRPGSSNASNNVFYVIPVFVAEQDFQLFIFNRWGELVHQSNGLAREDHQWNGGYKNNAGQPLPAGTYSYIVKFRSESRPNDGIQEKRGGVVLLR